ncbi:MAG: hypothetical protein IK990_20160 [Ruminiclostridium sp.]|nr:hypothetical protein [Ruminiclostridium sp.]
MTIKICRDRKITIGHLEKLRSLFDKASKDSSLQPWHRYSAAVGMAENASDDNSYELVFKRADKAMYQDKQEFKEKNGSYR